MSCLRSIASWATWTASLYSPCVYRIQPCATLTSGSCELSETALREAATLRNQRVTERMQRWREMRENRDAARPDPVQRLRTAADRMAESAATMRKIADAGQPLYASLDEAQKRRVDRIMMRRGMMMGGWGGHGMGSRGERHQDGPRRGPGGEGGRL